GGWPEYLCICDIQPAFIPRFLWTTECRPDGARLNSRFARHLPYDDNVRRRSKRLHHKPSDTSWRSLSEFHRANDICRWFALRNLCFRSICTRGDYDGTSSMGVHRATTDCGEDRESEL